jgi:hypothetical protein
VKFLYCQNYGYDGYDIFECTSEAVMIYVIPLIHRKKLTEADQALIEGFLKFSFSGEKLEVGPIILVKLKNE